MLVVIRAGAKRRDPVTPLRWARCTPKRDGRDKPGHDEVKNETTTLKRHA